MRNNQFSLEILDHARLMTPMLHSYFGEIYAVQREGTETPEIYNRISRVYCKANSGMLLDAKLRISKPALPEQLVEALRSTDVPFGKLLLDFGIAAKADRRVIFCQGNASAPDCRWGRRHRIVTCETGTELCDVEELLAPEAKLVAANKQFREAAV